MKIAVDRSPRHLWSGPVALLLLCVGTLAIGSMTPGYSHVRQTVSELGEIGAPGQTAFTVLLLAVATCLLAFAVAAARTLGDLGYSKLPAWFVGAMAISTAGVGLFPFPEPLHNVFGMSELIGYQAPLVAAVACRKERRPGRIVAFSAAMYCLVVFAIVANLAAIDRSGEPWRHLQPVFGLVQRALFAAWFLWCAGFALLLARADRSAA